MTSETILIETFGFSILHYQAVEESADCGLLSYCEWVPLLLWMNLLIHIFNIELCNLTKKGNPESCRVFSSLWFIESIINESAQVQNEEILFVYHLFFMDTESKLHQSLHC